MIPCPLTGRTPRATPNPWEEPVSPNHVSGTEMNAPPSMKLTAAHYLATRAIFPNSPASSSVTT